MCFLLLQECLLSIDYETGVLDLYPSGPPTCPQPLGSQQDAAGPGEARMRVILFLHLLAAQSPGSGDGSVCSGLWQKPDQHAPCTGERRVQPSVGVQRNE